MSHIFISYSRRDLNFAQQIVDALGENELDTWVDWKSIPKGEDWWEHIQNGIEEADAFLFLISPDSVESKVCQEEIEHAQKNGKRILPILIRDTRSKSAPEEIAKRNWIFCRERQDDFQAAIAVTLETIRTDYEWLKVHTRLQVKALEWERTKDPSRLLRGNELRQADEQLTEIETQKEPGPTVLQRQYLLASRRNEEQARRRTTVSLAVVLAVVVMVAIFAVQQRNTAVTESNAKATALVNEADARGTAQAEQKRAEEQARIARAGELAAQAELLNNEQAGTLEPSMLLAIESLKLSPSPAAAQLLNQGLRLLPSSTVLAPDEFIVHSDLSPDEEYMLVRTRTRAIVFEAGTGKEVLQATLGSGEEGTEEGPPTPMVESFGGVFDPFSRWLVTLDNNGNLRVWNIATGKLRNTIPFDSRIIDVRFSPDGGSLAILTEKGPRVIAFPDGEAIIRSDLEAEIADMAFSQDSQLFACAYDTSVQVWDLPTGRSLAVLPHEGTLIELAFAHNQGEHEMLSSLTAETLRIWDVETQASVTEIASLDKLLALSEDGLMFVSTGGHSFRVRSTESGDEILSAGTVGDVVGAKFSPEGNRLIVITGEPLGGRGEASLWNIDTNSEIARVPHNIWTGQFTIGNNRFFSTATRASVKLWNVEQGGALERQLNDKVLSASAFSHSGVWLATGGTGGVWLWHTLAEKQLAYIPIENLSGLALSPDDQYLAVRAGRQADLYSVPSGKRVRAFQHADEVKALAFDLEGKRLATASDSTIRIWNVTSGEPVEEIGTSSPGIDFLAFSSDNALLLGADPESVFVWEVPSGEQVFYADYPSGLDEIGFLPNSHKFYGSVFATDTDPGQAFLYDLDQEVELVHSVQRNAPLVYTRDGSLFATADDTTVRVWDTASGQEQFAFEAGFTILALAFSQDGNTLAVGGGELYGGAGQVDLWELKGGQKVGHFTQNRVIQALAFSSEDRLLATGSWDDTARVWEIASGQELFRLLSPGGVVVSVEFSPDDRWLSYGTDDHLVHISGWNPEDLIRSACKLIDYKFSDSEWGTYFPGQPYRFTCAP